MKEWIGDRAVQDLTAQNILLLKKDLSLQLVWIEILLSMTI